MSDETLYFSTVFSDNIPALRPGQVFDWRPPIRTFETGATRNVEADKYNYSGFLSPAVLERYAQYMHLHRRQADGTLREASNWKRGMPQQSYLESGHRHFMEWWASHEKGKPDMEALCALLFNVMGYMFEELKKPGA